MACSVIVCLSLSIPFVNGEFLPLKLIPHSQNSRSGFRKRDILTFAVTLFLLLYMSKIFNNVWYNPTMIISGIEKSKNHYSISQYCENENSELKSIVKLDWYKPIRSVTLK